MGKLTQLTLFSVGPMSTKLGERVRLRETPSPPKVLVHDERARDRDNLGEKNSLKSSLKSNYKAIS
jgi:hypothetical protein